MTNKQNADASESFRQLMAAYSKAFSSTPDSVKEEENADDTATTTENGTTRECLEPPPHWTPDDRKPTETALEFSLERALNSLNRQPRTGARGTRPEHANDVRRGTGKTMADAGHHPPARNTPASVTAIVFVGIQLWNCNAIVSEYVAYMIHTDKESPVVIISSMATSLGEVVGILWVIARNLFPFHDKHRDREAEKQNPKQTQLEKDTMTYIAKASAKTKVDSQN